MTSRSAFATTAFYDFNGRTVNDARSNDSAIISNEDDELEPHLVRFL